MLQTDTGPLAYSVREQRVQVGGDTTVLAAIFPLVGGGAACLQLQDQGALRRGGVYLLAKDDPQHPAIAPRFDELFADVASKIRAHAALQEEFGALLVRARDAAKTCQPRLTPEALQGLVEVFEAASGLDGRAPAGDGEFSWEELVVSFMLIFVSEEERYPRPKFRGGDMALARLAEATGLALPGSR
jgi:hypothetical protein